MFDLSLFWYILYVFDKCEMRNIADGHPRFVSRVFNQPLCSELRSRDSHTRKSGTDNVTVIIKLLNSNIDTNYHYIPSSISYISSCFSTHVKKQSQFLTSDLATNLWNILRQKFNDRLIFILGIPILVRRCLYIEPVPCYVWVRLLVNVRFYVGTHIKQMMPVDWFWNHHFHHGLSMKLI